MSTNPRSIFASDFHMGHRWSNFREFHAFLKSVDEPQHLYLVDVQSAKLTAAVAA
jgi:hypothetical protein